MLDFIMNNIILVVLVIISVIYIIIRFTKKTESKVEPLIPTIKNKNRENNINVFISEDIFEIMGAGTILVGRLKSGNLRKGMQSNINGKTSEILKIETGGKSIDVLTAGVSAGLILSNIGKGDIQKGIEYIFE